MENNIKQEHINETLIGACGIFCRACDHYFANTEEGAHPVQKSEIRKRVSAHPCMGCKAEDDNKICVYCIGCEVRLCSLEKNVRLCTECSRYPCDRLKKFHTGSAHLISLLSEKNLSKYLPFGLTKLRLIDKVRLKRKRHT